MGLSSAGESVVLNALLTGRYISAHTADPGNTGANEVAGGSYARGALGAYTLSGANPTHATNDAILEHPTATALWGTITHFGVWSASTGGTFLGGKALIASKFIDANYVLRYPASSIDISTDD